MKQLLPRVLVFSLVSCALFSSVSHAQVGIGTETPNAKAVLELISPNNNQGFLVPRLTTAQRTDMTLASVDKGMLVFDTSDNKFYYWSGTAWIVIEDSVGTGTVTNIATSGGLTGGPITVSGTISIADNGVTTLKLNNGAVTSAKLADDAVTSAKIVDATIATADLANGSVTAAKLANTAVTAGAYGSGTQVPRIDVDQQGRIIGVTLVTISGVAPSGAAGGDLTGTYPNPTIAANAVGSAEIADGSIVSADIADGTVAAIDLATNAVTTVKVADGAITDVKIAAVAPSKITQSGAATGQVLKWTGTAWAAQNDNAGTGTVTSVAAGAGLAGGTITTTGTLSLADGGVTTIKLADNAVSDAKIASVAPGKITAGSATTGQVLKWNGTAWTPQADNAGSGTLTSITAGTGLSGGTITTTGTIAIAANGVTATELRSDAATDANRAVTTNHVRDNAITSVKIVDGGVGNADLAANAVTSVKMADLSVTDAKISTVAPAKLTQSAATPGQVLKWNGTMWAPGTDLSGGGGVGGGGATGQVTYWGSDTDVKGRSGFVFEEKDIRLGIGTNTPMGNLHVQGSQFVNHVEVVDDYTVAATDYSLFIPNTAKPIDILLPPIAPANVGRILIIRTLNTQPVRLIGAVAPKDEIDIIGPTYNMETTGERYRSLILIGTQLASSDRWLILGGIKDF